MRGEQTVGDLVEWTGRSQPLVSQHLRILRTARLVSGERRGREVVYSLTDEHVAHVLLDAFQHTRRTTHDRHRPPRGREARPHARPGLRPRRRRPRGPRRLPPRRPRAPRARRPLRRVRHLLLCALLRQLRDLLVHRLHVRDLQPQRLLVRALHRQLRQLRVQRLQLQHLQARRLSRAHPSTRAHSGRRSSGTQRMSAAWSSGATSSWGSRPTCVSAISAARSSSVGPRATSRLVGAALGAGVTRGSPPTRCTVHQRAPHGTSSRTTPFSR
ncbi:MAG: metalloregulator ArsR/SmtB family transcription factor [Aeromicrobium erythreum]